jgi:beta-lactamase class A
VKVLLLVVGLLGVGGWAAMKAGLVKPMVMSFEKIQEKRETESVVQKVKEVVAGSAGEYGFWVWRLSKEEGYGWNENEKMPAMSILKVPVMAAVEEAIGEGKIKLDDIYKLRKEDKRSGSGPLEFYAVGKKLTVEELLTVMGKNSDNTALVVLTRMVGEEKVKEMVKKLDMGVADYDTNETTAVDLGKMWANLYKREVIGKESWARMQNYLTESIYEDRIPAGLPAGTKVVHKVGTDTNVWADAGIVYPGGGEPFVLVIVNKEVNLDEAKTVVPKIVKVIWEEELKQQSSDTN